MTEEFDIVVVGGGHAGCEAASAAARSGCRTLMIVLDRNGVGAMSCNPAIGGVGKGHIVREIDVFGGLIAVAADDAAIHYRMLNASKGVAVHGPRVQADRGLYRASIQARLARLATLSVMAGEVTSLSIAGTTITGVRLADGTSIVARAVILATGTFLGGNLFRGEERIDGGRLGEPGSHPLAAQLRDLGLATSRLKTGTPPRIDGRTIDWSQLDRQPSDPGTWTMASGSGGRRKNPVLFCGITRTNPNTHEIVRAASSRSPMFTGAIAGTGPRYCPSIEDKVVRFADREGHQIFLEPETATGPVIYPNGLSTSLPGSVQTEMVRSIAGLERADILSAGYAVEYDHIDPRNLGATLATNTFDRLFLAGQINGTTGYEEAAGQGLVAGVNAAAVVLGRSPVRFERDESYIGVMIDDLTLQGVTEPYRMLTARAEHRLSLRADNAEARLTDRACASGLLTRIENERLLRRRDLRATLSERMASEEREIFDLESSELFAEIMADRYYRPYVDRQRAEIRKIATFDAPIPGDLQYAALKGLSIEMVDRLTRARPETISQAGRIAGVTPAAVSALIVAVRRLAA